MDLLACFLFNIHTPYLGFFVIILPCKDDVRLHPTHDADPSSVNFVVSCFAFPCVVCVCSSNSFIFSLSQPPMQHHVATKFHDC